MAVVLDLVSGELYFWWSVLLFSLILLLKVRKIIKDFLKINSFYYIGLIEQEKQSKIVFGLFQKCGLINF